VRIKLQTVMMNDALALCSSRGPIREKKTLDTGGGRVFSLDASFGLLATASASALALFLGSALSFCGVSCMI